MQYTDAFHLNPKVVLRNAEVYAGYGAALRKEVKVPTSEAGRQTLIQAASCCLAAASYMSLVDQQRAKALFVSAAFAYAELGDPLVVSLAACGGQESLVFAKQNSSILGSDEEMASDVSLASLVAEYWRYHETGDFSENMLAEAKLKRALPTGRLGIPLGLYVEVVEEDLNTPPEERDFNSVVLHLRPVLSRMREATEVAMRDTYHWSRLESTLLPAEPEVLSLACTLVRLRDGSSMQQVMASHILDDMDPIEGAYLRLAANLTGIFIE